MHFYPSKIILFGEHTLLYGSEGLAVPGHRYQGRWNTGSARHHGTDLFALTDYLAAQSFHNPVDHRRMTEDAASGWFFDSNIPVGYGAGSSGAYSAAIYDRYGDIRNEDPFLIKEDLALIESFFHGSSSGIDPLISYYDRPFHLKKGRPEKVDLPAGIMDAFKLVDTKIPRQGSAYIQLFRQKMEEPVFAGKICETLIPACARSIAAAIAGDLDLLRRSFYEISYFQLVWMPEFIPLPWIRIWEHRLSDSTGFLKICGAGGGGFLLEIK